MPVSDRRAPRKVRRFAVLKTFRYQRRIYEEGGVFAPRGDVPRHRLDRLWRDGCIGTLDGDRCTAEKARPDEAAQQDQEPSPSQAAALEALAASHDAGDADDEPEAAEAEDESEEDDEDLPEYGEDHLD